jgi:hypothetical protein
MLRTMKSQIEVPDWLSQWYFSNIAIPTLQHVRNHRPSKHSGDHTFTLFDG